MHSFPQFTRGTLIFGVNFIVRVQFSWEQLSSGATVRGQFSSGAIIHWDNCPGAIIQAAIIRVAIFLRGICPRTVYSYLIVGINSKFI